MLLHDLILHRTTTLGTKPALLRGADSSSYAELAEQLRCFAAGLVGRGLQPGERIAVYSTKRVEAVVSYFGSSLAGAVFVPVNPSLKPAQVAHILVDCEVSALVTTEAQASALAEVLATTPHLRLLILLDQDAPDFEPPSHLDVVAWHDLLDDDGTEIDGIKRIDADVAAIFYTSGSSGRPKGVVLSHRNVVAGAVSVAQYLGNTADDIILAALPFSFDAGFSQMTTSFSVGATVVLTDYLVPQDVLKTAAHHRATGLAGVPPLWTQLARVQWPKEAVESLRYITNTGGTMPKSTLDILRQRLPQTSIYLMYGLTEAFRSTYLPPEELERRPTSIGKAIPNAQILVVREDGTPCAPGEPGELVHRGALVSLGYWNDPEGTAERFRPAPNLPEGVPLPEIAVWSGDKVVADDEGFLYFIGRSDDMIKSSGYRISPTELEEVVYNVESVIECAAFGVPHGVLGQAVVIVYRAEGSEELSRNAILAACATSLPGYMMPQEVQFRGELPRNPNGKIDRHRLSKEHQHLFSELEPG